MKKENYNFLVDYYAKKFIEHKPEVITKILEIIFNKDDLILDSVISQYTITNVENRSIILDVLAKDKDNNIYNIEFQNQNIKGLNKRARFHHSMIDSNNFKKNADFEELNNTYVIFICNFDPFKKGLPLYIFKRKEEKEIDINYIDGDYTIFVNCKYKDTTTDIGKLIQDLTSNNTDEKWYNEFKEGQDIGGDKMGDGLERWKNKFRREGKREGLAKGLLKGKAEGLAEGIQKGINQSIQGMIRENLSNEMISRICNVSSDYIGNIRKKMEI